ncbi:MAG: hypothetical protein B7Z40_08560 [Bosea sp. 12-68-7]|nr:MAG: hypothetical protein B7Z40_08560 [Bosea sp. 12-68-7]
MSAITEIPEGVEVSATLYLISDSTGMELDATVHGIASMAVLAERMDAARSHIAKLSDKVTDWRLMTREEIADAKRRKAEEAEEEPEAFGSDEDEGDWS